MTQPRGRTPQDVARSAGFLQVPRKTFHPERGDPLWLEDRRLSRYEAWLDLVQMAQLRGRTVTWRNHTVEVPRAHLLASVRTLADRWQWSKGAVERFVRWCAGESRLRTVSETPIGTLYLIVHYESYAGTRDTLRDTARDTNGDSDGTATGTRTEIGERAESGENASGGGGAPARGTSAGATSDVPSSPAGPAPAPATPAASAVPAAPDDALGYPENAVHVLTAHVNKGLREHVEPARRQLDPIRASAPGSVATVANLRANGVPFAFAGPMLYEVARTHGAEGAVRALTYFANPVLRAWEKHRADLEAAALPAPAGAPSLTVARPRRRDPDDVDFAALARAQAARDGVLDPHEITPNTPAAPAEVRRVS